MNGISTIKNAFLSDFKHIDFYKVIRYMQNKDNILRLFRSCLSLLIFVPCELSTIKTKGLSLYIETVKNNLNER